MAGQLELYTNPNILYCCNMTSQLLHSTLTNVHQMPPSYPVIYVATFMQLCCRTPRSLFYNILQIRTLSFTVYDLPWINLTKYNASHLSESNLL